jgi:predicted nucleotidyltransferase
MNFHDLIKTFKVKPELNKKFWDENGKLDPVAKNAMLKTVKLFYKSINIEDKPEIIDVIFTGSLANYNWSKFSDIDIHLLFDYSQYGENIEVFEKYFLLAKNEWNLKHNIAIKGFDVELYTEDYRNPHHSTGVYSLLTDRWLRVPKKQVPLFDPNEVVSKVSMVHKQYNQLVDDFMVGDHDTAIQKINNFRRKLTKYRKSGLEKGGEFSNENITFKMLRRSGLLDKIMKLYTKIVDTHLSVDEKTGF